MQARSYISVILIILFLTRLMAINAHGFANLSIAEELVLTKPPCENVRFSAITANLNTTLAVNDIHLLVIKDFCNVLTEISLFPLGSEELLSNAKFTSLFFTNLNSRHLNSLSPPPKA